MAAGAPDAALAVPGPVVPCPPVLLPGPRPPFPMFPQPPLFPHFPVQFPPQAGFPLQGFPGYNFHGSVITVEHSVQRNRGSHNKAAWEGVNLQKCTHAQLNNLHSEGLSYWPSARWQYCAYAGSQT
uniref:Uncharacterized protein n=1 Tax=Branchiostoma floridae TaxID=7739 RepID=C3YSG2_BRAFL|eukprot:XP_002600651.1 hypothetical protein BRAFLDRAFT_102431 [Branchiostoma floridae]